MVVCSGFWRFLVFLACSLWFLGVLVIFGGSHWLLVIICVSLSYFVVLGDPWWFVVMMIVILMKFLG